MTWLPRAPRHRTAWLLLALGLPCAGSARALERITLRNGFTYDCTRTESLGSAQIRLYLASGTAAAPGTAAANYVDLPASSVAGIETLPDPPAPTPDPAAQPRTDLGSLLRDAGAVHNIDLELLASIVHAESGGRANAISRAGAVGLMQLMPSTALALGIGDPTLPQGNINGGTAYLDALLKRYKDNLALALAAYNAGPAAVDRYHGIPPFAETRAYVVRVMTEFKRRKLELARSERAAR